MLNQKESSLKFRRCRGNAPGILWLTHVKDFLKLAEYPDNNLAQGNCSADRCSVFALRDKLSVYFSKGKDISELFHLQYWRTEIYLRGLETKPTTTHPVSQVY